MGRFRGVGGVGTLGTARRRTHQVPTSCTASSMDSATQPSRGHTARLSFALAANVTAAPAAPASDSRYRVGWWAKYAPGPARPRLEPHRGRGPAHVDSPAGSQHLLEVSVPVDGSEEANHHNKPDDGEHGEGRTNFGRRA
jgi:hypothetical protein